jgi:predicted nucleic acid-binding protein
VSKTVLVDTGPLVAFVNARDRHHSWAKDQLAAMRPPLATCDAVLTEVCYLVRGGVEGPAAILAMLSRGLLTSSFRLEEHAETTTRLMRRYASVPMDLADACLVRMTELAEDPVVLTLDDDFLIYRRHGRQRIPTIMPPR